MAAPADLKFNDISVEQWREYRYPGGEKVRIEKPVKLNVSASGGHRIEDAAGMGHYVPSGWLHLYWQPQEGQPVFVC